jgi:hypothetical protein
MNDQKLDTPGFLKREAKKLAKQSGIPHHVALDQVARSRGFANWLNFCNKSKAHAAEQPTPTLNLVATSQQPATLSFTKWLGKHRKRSSPLGDLARDVAIDDTWPEASSLADYRQYFSSLGLSGRVVEVLENAWRSYRAFVKRSSQPQKQRPKRVLAMVPKRRIVWVKGIKPLHISKREAERLPVGAEAWVSFNGRKALPVIITEVDEPKRHCGVRFERPSTSIGIDRIDALKTTTTHGFFLNEVRSTPELACLNCVTL